MMRRGNRPRRRESLATMFSRRALVKLALACAAAGLGTGAVRADDAHARVAAPAPRFDLETPSGGDLTLDGFRGRPLVLNVFASWCPPCREELPRIAKAARAQRDVAFVGVDEQEAVEIATTFARAMHLPYPIAIDHGQFAATYGAVSLPETIFVDARGTVRAIVHGTISARTLARDLSLVALRSKPAGT
jgi:cytochrome c biogenesis protein CcmG/thiol:disulfide interchange protein DsbE